MKRRDALLAPGALALPGLSGATVDGSGKKILRLSFRVAETGFDPAQINDVYSRTVTPHIFEALYRYDPLARPAKVLPLTAEGPPEHNENFTVWTFKVRRGIFFADDPAFKGQPRELTAQDYVYSVKRFADPAVKSPAWTWVESFDLLGLAELRKEALASKKPFDYDRPIEGLVALDRYTVRCKVAAPRPRFLYGIPIASDLTGAVAREVVETYGDTIMAHPVGTGPFRLAQWRRSSFIALERNPAYREVRYESEPDPSDAQALEIVKQLNGRRLPLVDRVEVSIIEENQPRWLNFLQGASDVLDDVPADFISQALPGGKTAPYLAKRGIRGHRMVRQATDNLIFNMEDPLVGGMQPHQVALRRAIGLGYDVMTEIARVWRGEAIPAQAGAAPHTYAYNAQFKSAIGDYNPAKANALLDLYGYLDRNGDGWRERPDGSPLVLKRNTQPDKRSREQDELFDRNMKAIGLKVEFVAAKWPENLRSARGGKFMMWTVGNIAADPDGQNGFQRYSSKAIGGQNFARFKLPAIDVMYDKLSEMPDGPERKALFDELRRLSLVYMPYKPLVHRMVSDLVQPWVIGYRRPLWWQEWWHVVDVLPGRDSPA